MTEFEFIFVLYALILGLSLVALLGGLGRAIERAFAYEARDGTERFRIGTLTPLMAVFVMLDLMSFWIFAWIVRDIITVSPATLIGIMAFASAYYLAARLVFPEEPERFADLDTHYFRVSRTIFGILIALVAVQWAFLLSIPGIRGVLLSFGSVAATAMFVALMGAAMIWRNRHVQAVLLIALIVRYLVLYLFI